MSLERHLVNSFFSQLAEASISGGQISQDYQLGFLNGVLNRLVLVSGVKEVLLQEVINLGHIARKRLQNELEIAQHQAHTHKELVKAYRKEQEQKSVEVSTPKPETRNMIKTATAKYKPTVEKVLKEVAGIEQIFCYYNDLIKPWANKKTSRRIKIGIARPQSDFVLGTLSAALSAAFDCKIDVKNSTYWNRPTLIIFFRR